MSDTSSPQTIQATSITALEDIIKGYLADINSLREKLKSHKSMIEDAVSQDKTYAQATEKQKEVKREIAQAKQEVTTLPAVVASKTKIKDISLELKEAQIALSDYLNQYVSLTQSSDFTGADGEVMQIVRSAKLIKKK